MTFPVGAPTALTPTSAALATTWVDAINYLQDVLEGPPTAYTPVWSTATGASPVVGSGGSVVGEYKELGGLVWVHVILTLGSSGVTFGTGAYRFSPPVTITGRHLLNATLRTSVTYRLHIETDAGSNLFIVRADPTSSTSSLQAATAGLPTTWAVNNVFEFSGWYK